jgi:hypothetical protein
VSRSVEKSGTQISAYFNLYDSANAPVTTAVNADFEKKLTLDGANNTTTVTISHVADGRYVANFTPASAGQWSLRIRHATHAPRGFQEDYVVTTGGRVVTDTSGYVALTPNAIGSGHFLPGAITASAIATGAIDADAIAADAVAEIQSGLATAAALQTVDDLVDDLETRLTADRAAALDNLDATISSRASAADQATIIGHVDTLEAEVAALAAALAAIDVPTADENADALLDRINAIEDATVRQALTAIYDVLLAGASEGWQGGSAGTVVFKNKAGTVDRVTVDVDQHGNRSNIVVDHS